MDHGKAGGTCLPTSAKFSSTGHSSRDIIMSMRSIYQNGGEWSGEAFMCTRERSYTIKGTADCVARGHERTGFYEVDTGDQQSWTVQLKEPDDNGVGGR